jgi:hypothetical protein
MKKRTVFRDQFADMRNDSTGKTQFNIISNMTTHKTNIYFFISYINKFIYNLYNAIHLIYFSHKYLYLFIIVIIILEINPQFERNDL